MTLIRWREFGRLIFLFCAFSTVTTSAGSGQGLTTGVLSGVVTSQAGATIGDVLVTITNPLSGVTRSVATDMNGSFRFSQLPTGDFDLLVEHSNYKPLRVTAIPIRPGQRLSINVEIAGATGPVSEADVIHFESGVLSGTLPQFNEWFTRQHLSGLPHRSRELGEAFRLSSNTALFGAVEGLPVAMLGQTVDAVPYRNANPAIAATLGFSEIAVPLGAVEAAQLATNVVDVERSGFAGAMLNGFSRHGTGETQARLLAQYTASATGDEISGVERPTDVQAAALVSGALVRDSAHYLLGVEFRRYQAPFPSFWVPGDEANAVVAAAAPSRSLQRYVEPRLTRSDAITGFGGAEWQLTERHRLETRLAFGVAPHADQIRGDGPFSLENQASSSSAFARASLLSEFSPGASNEIRLAATLDGIDVERQTEGVFSTEESIPLTTLVGSGLTFGGAHTTANMYRRREFSFTDAFTASVKQHQLKFGVSAELAAIEQTRAFTGTRTWFGGISQFTAREGWFVQPLGTPGAVEFTLAQIAGFAQNTWRPLQGMEVVLGVRYEREMLPTGDVVSNEQWQRLTDLNNTDAPASYGKISPRFSIKWDPQEKHRWIFAGGAGVYHAMADADVIAELIGNDGRTRVARRLEVRPVWPGAISDTTGAGRSLTLISPNYRPPVSTRASAGLTRMLDAHSAMHVAASYRDTRHLPRRSDLNTIASPLSEDQYGRAIFGQLVQQGELIAPNPSTNRRFAGFDQVTAINSDGKSQYRAISVVLERMHTAGLGLYASYTYSKTEDNWYGARGLSEPAVAPRVTTDAAGDWADGTSDFDVPHRAVLSAEIPAPGGITVAALYRYESGMPFTPALPEGVDANGDGFANDPAFVDEDIDGTSEVIGNWSCLRSQIGQIAERNSCRGEAVQSLDLRVSARVGVGSRALRINVDALNVLQSEVGIIENALYRADSAGLLSTTAGITTIPLVSNPRFGEIRHRMSAPRLIRVGVQFNW